MEQNHTALLKSFRNAKASRNSLTIRNKDNLKHEEKIKVFQEEVRPFHSTITLLKDATMVSPQPPLIIEYQRLMLTPSGSNSTLNPKWVFKLPPVG